MSEQPEDGSKPNETSSQGAAQRDPLDGEGESEGIELTMGAPNSFEPEEDPDAADDEADA